MDPQGHQDFQTLGIDIVLRIWCLERAMLFSRDPADVLPAAQFYLDFLNGSQVDTTGFTLDEGDLPEDVVGADLQNNLSKHAPVGIQLGKGLDLSKADPAIEALVVAAGSDEIVKIMADAEAMHKDMGKKPANEPVPEKKKRVREITDKQQKLYNSVLEICKKEGPLNAGQLGTRIDKNAAQIIDKLRALVEKGYLVGIEGPLHRGRPTTLFYPVELGEPALEKKSVAGK